MPDAVRRPSTRRSRRADPRHRDRHRAGRRRHRRPRGRARLDPLGRGPPARRDAHARRSSSPAARPASSCREISVVAVDLGPGLFTGLRVGVAAAKAMAHALRVPMIGVPSLDLLAFPRALQPAGSSSPPIDARRGELFYAFYRQVPGGVQRLTRPPRRLARRPRLRAAGHRRGVPARRRRRPALPRGVRRPAQGRDRRGGPGLPVGRRRWCMLAHAQALREQWVQAVGPPAALPAQARRRDQLADPGRPA